MRAQVSLTPAEAKKLISKAIANMDEVRSALHEGVVVIHPSSTTYFLAEELIQGIPPTDVWVCGLIAPRGTCSELAVRVASMRSRMEGRSGSISPLEFEHSWVIEDGKLSSGVPLGVLLDQMSPRDVYVKSPNAIDPDGRVAVLIGNPEEGGTIGRVMAASRRKGFRVVFAVGLEKLIPISVNLAAAEARRKDYTYSMGMPCSLLPCEGTVVTEVQAIELLSGAKGVPIAAGGLSGAEGSVTMVIKGAPEQVERAIEVVEACKGATVRAPRLPQCISCQQDGCSLAGVDKRWTRH